MSPDGKGRNIKPPLFIELNEIKDLARLVCAFERIAMPIFYLDIGGKKKMIVQLDLFKGKPIFYYAEALEFRHYLGYRNSAGFEETVLSDTTSNPIFIYAPIISVKKLPDVFIKGLDRKDKGTRLEKFLSIQVGDLASLAKVGSYKILFEEPPLPLFLFPRNNRWILGTFTHIDEYDEASIFFYLFLNEEPSTNFLKYSAQRSDQAYFTSRIDEHGYIYLKIARLSNPHPLVDV